ncbi:centrosomal protein of 72 kDa [Ctenodactylus gundi]
MAPVPRLVLSEDAVRERSGLGPHRDLAELQSLSLPGTYQEKITHLGNSLMHLTSLKFLDLSRNALVSLEGIQYLVCLESLRLYCNCISSLAEVFRLHSLTELQDVDLRLNPVVKNESDYRQFVLHMLPNLQQLDDRLVRESERQASQLRFALEDPLKSKESFPATFTFARPHHSRAKCTDASASKCLVMDADDEAVLNLIAECEWDLKNPPGSMSSSQEHETYLCHTQGACPTFGADSMDIEDSASSSQKPSLPSQKVFNPLLVPERYRKHKMPGGRLQTLSEQACPSFLVKTAGPCGLGGSVSRQENTEDQSQGPRSLSGASEVQEPTPLILPPVSHSALEVALLEALLDLVDRYWSGCRSLHSNEVFLAQARHVLSSVRELAAAPEKEDTHCLTLENKSLPTPLAKQQRQCLAAVSQVTAELSSMRQEMDTLRQYLGRSLEENNNIKSLLFNMKKEVKNAGASAGLNLQITGLQASLKQLSGEVVELKQHLEHYDRIQELTQMLQESHSSLVSTNEHLLQELSRERLRHRAEVEQMHWSFLELKKTATLFPPHGRAALDCSSCGNSPTSRSRLGTTHASRTERELSDAALA